MIPARYVHLSGRDVDGSLVKYYGESGDASTTLRPRCGFMNQGGLYCARCSTILFIAEAQRVEERRMRENELVERVVRKLIELAHASWSGPWSSPERTRKSGS